MPRACRSLLHESGYKQLQEMRDKQLQEMRDARLEAHSLYLAQDAARKAEREQDRAERREIAKAAASERNFQIEAEKQRRRHEIEILKLKIELANAGGSI